MPNPRTVTIGTRGSALALWQAEHVAARLRDSFSSVDVRLERITTSGDRIQDVPLSQVGGKALFVKEIEEALLAGRVDLAVHSMKDVPAEVPPRLTIQAILEREDPRDVLVSRGDIHLDRLPRGARIGTSSLRRRSQLLHRWPDVTIVPLRGNLDTRVRKLDAEGLDAIVVALAGVRRLGLDARITEILDPEVMLPAVGQGALGVEIRVPGAELSAETRETRPRVPSPRRGEGGGEGFGVDRDAWLARLVLALDDASTHLALRAERALLRRLGGSCQIPVAAHARLRDGLLQMEALVAGVDGTPMIRAGATGPVDAPESLGEAVAGQLLSQGAGAVLRALARSAG